MTGFFVGDKPDEFEILFQFEPKPFPDLKCNDCGEVKEDCKERPHDYGVQCYKCYKDDKEFENDYR